MKVKLMKQEIELPEKVEVKLDGSILTVKGEKGELSRNFAHKNVSIRIEDKKIILFAEKATKREKTMIGTFKSHVKNMLRGVQRPFVYKMKICASHFPITASVQGDTFEVKNFLGEKVPRKLKIKPGAKITINAPGITVESVDKEIAGQVAADIEQLTRITDKDTRIFQDGIYITAKDDKVLG